MALKLRLDDVWQFGGDQENATLFVKVAVFDDANDRIVDTTTFQYDLHAFEAQNKTNAAKLQRLRADAEAFGQGVRESAAITQKLAGMVGTIISIPED